MAFCRPVAIRQWPVSYYSESRKRWLYGTLSVTAEHITFAQKDKPTNMKVMLNFKNFTAVQKTTTTLIFSSLTISTTDKQKHWFSSLPDRSSIFNVIHHFWKCRLISKNPKRSQIPENERTTLGRRLLTIVDDSEKTLQNAASTLYNQGEQLDSALGDMGDIHNDLDVANNIVQGFETWLGRWRLPNKKITIDPFFITDEDIPQIYEYEVLYTRFEADKANSQNLGTFRIHKEGLIILTLAQKEVHNFKWKDISRVEVLTPWEMIVTKFLIGKPDLSFVIVCTNLLEIVRLLQKPLKNKIEFDDIPHFEEDISPRYSQSCDKTPVVNCSNSKDLHPARRLEVSHDVPVLQLHTESQPQQQIQESKVISDSEVQQLSSALSELKSLALSVKDEQEIQNDKIGSLTSSVDSANARVANIDKRVKKQI